LAADIIAQKSGLFHPKYRRWAGGKLTLHYFLDRKQGSHA